MYIHSYSPLGEIKFSVIRLVDNTTKNDFCFFDFSTSKVLGLAYYELFSYRKIQIWIPAIPILEVLHHLNYRDMGHGTDLNGSCRDEGDRLDVLERLQEEFFVDGAGLTT